MSTATAAAQAHAVVSCTYRNPRIATSHRYFDFNCVAHDFCVAHDLDVTSTVLGSRRTGFQNRLEIVQQVFGLTDVWREQHPSVRAVTYVCASEQSGARLDHILVSTHTLLHATNIELQDGRPGDHVAVSM